MVTRQSHSKLVRAAAGLLAATVLVVTAILALIAAFGVAYLAEPGPARVQEAAPALGASVVIGSLGVATALALLRRSVLSPWLLVGLLPASAATMSHLGLL
jgi:ABC-type phosphate transport system auxiliary subunit